MASQATDVGGEKIRQSFNDLSSLTNFGFQIVGGVSYNNKYTFNIDATIANLGAKSEQGPLTIDFDIVQYIIDNRFAYTLYSDIDYSKQNEVIRGWNIQANIGVKYWLNNITLNYNLDLPEPFGFSGNLKQKQEWFDLMIGSRANIILSKTVLLSISGSAGGFGIGNSSDFSFDFVYSNTFRVSKSILVSAGYKTFQYNRTDDGLKTKVAVFGPFVGASFYIL